MSKGLAYAYRVLGLAVEPEAPAPAIKQTKACRRDVQRRLMLLSDANAATPGERVAKDLLIRRCRACGECWLARL